MLRTRLLPVLLVTVLLVGILGPVTAVAAADAGASQGPSASDASRADPSDVDDPFAHDDASTLEGLTRDAEAVGSSVAAVGVDASHELQSVGVPGGLDGPPTGLVLVASYSRYDDSDPLENDARSQIFDAIRNSPGTYAAALAESTSSSRSTVRYHVRILESEGLVVAEKVGGKQRYFPASTDDVELHATFNDDATRSVLSTMNRLGAVTVTDLADALDRAASTTSYHLSRLAERDLIEQERVDGAVVNRLAPKTERALHGQSVDSSIDAASTTSD